MWVLIDNYDSFTHILHDYLLQTGNECSVYRNDELTVAELAGMKPSRIIISPGPETPLQAGITMEAVAHFHDKIPVLGICLGHQAIGMYFGAKLIHAPQPVHGKVRPVSHNNESIFNGLPNPMGVMRYHSLTLDCTGNEALEVMASTEDNVVMAVRHRLHPCIGIQFHPESIGTPQGLQLLKNWANNWAK